MTTTAVPVSIHAYDADLAAFRRDTAAGLAELLARTLLAMHPRAHTLRLPTIDAHPTPDHLPGDTDRPLVLDRDNRVVLRVADRHLPYVTDPTLLALWEPLTPDDPDALLTVVDALRRAGAILARHPHGAEHLPLSEDAVRDAGGHRLRWADPYARHADAHDLDADAARLQVAADAHARLLADTLRSMHPGAHYLVFAFEHHPGEDEAYIDFVHMLDADGTIVWDFDFPTPTPNPLSQHLRLAWGYTPRHLDLVEAVRRLYRAGFRFDELPHGEHRLPHAPTYTEPVYCLRLTSHARARHFHDHHRNAPGARSRHRRLQPMPPRYPG
ncbi:hypothetical protein [Embleya sp. NPDC059237]|uniref:hypothetical protein n=1 Tax=Embleya sp. NPDC059237 TaxID=3346784 RepID=UPI003687F148